MRMERKGVWLLFNLEKEDLLVSVGEEKETKWPAREQKWADGLHSCCQQQCLGFLLPSVSLMEGNRESCVSVRSCLAPATAREEELWLLFDLEKEPKI